MINGVCPKCQAAEVYRGVAAEGEGITAGSYPAQIEIIAGQNLAAVNLDTFVCRRCGYIELYAANPVDLEWLPQADGWVKVEAQA
jgi:predicted nucleic-acid-binding Zn-ribbon protein